MAMVETMASKKAKRKYKPEVSVGISVNTRDAAMTGPPTSSDWRKEEKARITAEIGAIEDKLKGFNAQEEGMRVKRGLEMKLKMKKLRLEECKLKMSPDYDY